MNRKPDSWLPRIALSALALQGLLVIWGSISLQNKQQPVPDLLERSGMITFGALAIVATSGRNRPPLN
jgi:hypothetical protein